MSHGRDTSPKPYAVVAEFETPDQLLSAVERTKDAGYRDVEAYSPVPVHGLTDKMGFKDDRLWLICFIGGVTGACLGMALEWYTSAGILIPNSIRTPFGFSLPVPAPTGVDGYAHNTGGKPLFSLPAFVPVAYELTILLSAFGATFGMLGLNGLPKPHNPIFNASAMRGASQNRYILSVEATDPNYNEVELSQFLNSLNPLSVEAIKTSEGY